MGSFFYIKKSLGLNGKRINVYKIRTMCKNAENQISAFCVRDQLGKPINDPRILPWGRFLRKYWIDEIPQIYNLLKGDVKLVGIRPMGETNWEKYPVSIKEKALKQKPALMGIQYSFQYSESFNDGIQQITDYLDKWESNATKTDFIYFFRIMYHIIFGGVRSK